MDMNVALKISAGVTGQQAVDQLRTTMDRLDGSVTKIKGAFIALGGAAVLGGFVGMIKGAIDTGDKLNDLSQKTGIAVEDLDALGFAAELNGSNLEQVSGALSKLSKNMAEAAGGGKEAIGVFKQFGISQGELKAGSVTLTDAMARIADKIAAMPDGWQKTAAAQKAFGKSAADIVPLLNAGGDAIRDARAQLEGYGALFTGGFAKASDDFNDKMALMRRMSGALALSFAKELLPVMSGFLQGLIDAKTRVGDVAGDSSLAEWAAVAAQGIAALVDVIKVAAQAVIAILGSFKAVWADIEFGGSLIANGPAALFSAESRAKLSAALEERNKIVEEANQRYEKLWTMNGSATFDAVKAQMDKLKTTIKDAGDSAKGKGGAGGGFDFSAGKETEFTKLKQQLEEQLSKTGELTKMQEIQSLLETKRFEDLDKAQKKQLINLAKEIDSKAALQKIEEMQRKEGGAIQLLELEGQKADMTSREYEKLVAAKKHDQEVTEATRRMNADDAAKYREIADALFAQKQAVEDLNYANSRTFGAGAKQAFNDYLESVKNVSQSVQTLFSNAFRGMEDALVNFVMTGKLNFKDLANSIIKDMIRILVQQSVMRPLMGAMGGLFGGSSAANYSLTTGQNVGGLGLKGPSSFDGGGYTGGGLRMGGLDGKGGFMAILHPNETVLDHTKGQGIGSTANNVVVNVNVESGSQQVTTNQGAGNLGAVIANAVKAELINQKRPGGLLAA